MAKKLHSGSGTHKAGGRPQVRRPQRRPQVLSHVDASGRAKMVDVGVKPVTAREAVARGVIRMRPETLRLIQKGGIAKGDVLTVARIAGIMAAKRTADIIPMCHPLPIEAAVIDLTPTGPGTLQIEARVNVTGKTGVEMEALAAVAIVALTVYDMCKAVDRGMVIGDIRLMKKRGGRSGVFQREE